MTDAVDHPGFWDEKYVNGQTGWDLKTPTPIFTGLLDESMFIKPCKMLISGCGKGYDAVAAALRGFDVTGVDFSAAAISFAAVLAEDANVKINFIVEDIFNLSEEIYSFDAVYDYATFCAINPERREEYANKLARLIKPGGKFIAILFPIDGREGGPPFDIDPVEFYTTFSRHFKLEYSSRFINSIKPRSGKEMLQIYIRK